MAVGTITQLALSNQETGQQVPVFIGNQKVGACTVVGSSSYTTGGDTLALSNFGLVGLNFAIVFISASSGSNNAAVSAQYLSTGKLQCFSATDAAGCPVAETSSTTNLSGLTFTVIAFGY
jgi:hypothetical protein